MRALWAVYKRETAHYFRSFIAYGIAFALIGFMGLYFMGNVSVVQQQTAMQGVSSIPATNLASFNLSVFTFLLFLIAPLLTMRLLAEETREGTLEVLMTLPMGDWAFVAGKFLAAWTFYTVMLLLTLVHVGLLAQYGAINPGLLFANYLGAWLYGGATLAISTIWSAVTEDQLVAAFLGAATVLALYLAQSLAGIVSDQRLVQGASNFVRQLGLTTHYQDTMAQGILRAEDVTYFVLLIFVSLFITTLIVGTRRWRAS
jgi:ABC-2 type transport system permease protein